MPCHEKNDRVTAFGAAVNAYLPPSARRGFRIAALIAAVICVLAIAAGAFVVSYTGVRDMALTAGVTAHYARFYPGIFDAVFVVAAVAALSLRGALRAYAWLAILVILGAVAAADAIHAMSIVLPKRPTEATVAAAPWAVLLIGFTLLYAMARQALPTRRATAAADPTSNGRAENGEQVTQVPLSALLADKPATRPERAQVALTAQAATATATRPDLLARTGLIPAKTEPITAKTEPIAPKAEPITPETGPLSTKIEPAAAKTELIAAKTEPVSTQWAAAEPVASEPITAARTEPVSTKPVPTEPDATESVTVAGTGPVSTKPVPPEPIASEPITAARTEPVSTKPVPAEPATTEPATVAGTGPVSTEPTAAEPVTTEPVAEARTEPVTTWPTSTEFASSGLVSGETEPATRVPPTVPEPVASPADPYVASRADAYPARTQQFAVRRPQTVARPFFEPDRPFTEPELSARQPAERDDPSDADAEPVEPGAHFNRLRSGPTPPDED